MPVVAAFVNCVIERVCFSLMSVLLFHYFIAEIHILLSNMLANSPPPTRRVGSIKCCCILIHEQSALQINCLVVTSAELKPVITEQLLYVNCISITFSILRAFLCFSTDCVFFSPISFAGRTADGKMIFIPSGLLITPFEIVECFSP